MNVQNYKIIRYTCTRNDWLYYVQAISHMPYPFSTLSTSGSPESEIKRRKRSTK